MVVFDYRWDGARLIWRDLTTLSDSRLFSRGQDILRQQARVLRKHARTAREHELGRKVIADALLFAAASAPSDTGALRSLWRRRIKLGLLELRERVYVACLLCIWTRGGERVLPAELSGFVLDTWRRTRSLPRDSELRAKATLLLERPVQRLRSSTGRSARSGPGADGSLSAQ